MLDFFLTEEDLDAHRAKPAPYNAPRALTGSAERLKINEKRPEKKVDKRPVSAWQTAAWQFYDQIGEVKFAFSLIGQIISRARIYAAMIEEEDQPPVPVTDLLERIKTPDSGVKLGNKVKKGAEAAQRVVEEFNARAANGISTFLREAAINVSVPGEFYVADFKDQWHVLSSDELETGAGSKGYKVKRDRTAQSGHAQAYETLDENAYVARVWRSHPRFSHEPDSSMLGVLDQCEQLVLLDQAMRVITRSRLNAGALFIPDGVGATDIESAIANAATQPLEDEAAMTTVVPLLLRGPAELGKEIKLIDLSRRVDAEMLEQQSRALDRVLAGADIPKDIVGGLSEVRYSNAIVITDDLYRSHIEPLIMLIVDALTSVILRPQLEKDSVDVDTLNKLVVWYDPSDIVTRPDQSSAANEGYDRHILSAKAWRASRGFNEYDAPNEDEMIKRLAIEKATIPPEMAAPMIEAISPKFFGAERSENSASVPAEVRSILGGPPATEAEAPEGAGQEDQAGGEVAQGGFMPPGTRPPA